MIRLRHVVRISPSPTEINGLDAGAAVTFAPMDALADGLGGLDATQVKPLSEVARGSYNYFREGDILLAKVTPCFENGKKAIAHGLSNGIGFATSEVHVLRPDSCKIDVRFLHYLLCSEDFRANCMKSMTGAGGLRRVSEKAILDWHPKITHLDAQRAIADFLDRETARIDRLIEKKQRLVELLREKYFAELDGLTFPEVVPKNELVPFRWICLIAEGQVDPTSDKWRDRMLVAPNHIESRTGRLLASESAEEQGAISGKYAFGAGTVLYSKIRPALAKACISQHAGMCSADMYPIIPDKRLRPEYLLMQLLSARFTDWATLESMRVAMPKINRETLGRFRLRVPPPEVQGRYVSSFERSRVHFEGVTDKIETSIDRLKEYRSALITAAVTGQIDVTAWGNEGKTDRRLDQIGKDMALREARA